MSTNKKAALGEDRAAEETQSCRSDPNTRDAKSSFAQAAIEVVRRAEQRDGAISMSRHRFERAYWARYGLTLAQRDAAVRALVDSGDFQYVVDASGPKPPRGNIYAVQWLVARRVERDGP